MSHTRWAFNTRLWLNSVDNWKKCLSSIQAEEVDRISQFVFRNSAVSSLVGRLLLRRWVTQQVSIPWKSVVFSRSDKGRPFLVWPEGVEPTLVDVNVSHQGDWVVLAGCMNAKVGVDVMKVEYSGGKSLQEFFRLMNRQFTADEWRTITGSGDEDSQLACFYRHWCLKESVVKAMGIGIGFDLQKISFQVNTPLLSEEIVTVDTTVTIEGVPDCTRWCFEECKLDNDHCAAVAYLPALAATASNSLNSLQGASSDEPIEAQLDQINKTSFHGGGGGATNFCFHKLSLDDVLDEAQLVTEVSDELAQKMVDKELAHWL